MSEIEVLLLKNLKEIDPVDWDLCACPEAHLQGRPFDPFTTFRFLSALEESQSVGEGTGWTPQHFVAKKNNELIAVMPSYLKEHSQGEYIFDHNWAQAYSQAGGRYYPKFQSAVPFTPATGRRLLTKPGMEEEGSVAILTAAQEVAKKNQISSIHLTFCSDKDVDFSRQLNFISRKSLQYQWLNKDYKSFDQFLDRLTSRKRKAIRKERRTALEFGGKITQFTGNEIKPAVWDSFWKFYQDTGARKWGTPYLTRAFFDILQEQMRDDILLLVAERENKPIAAALNFIGRETLFGRYWGCIEEHSCLHYELCYYQAMDYALLHKLQKVEAGAQGEHKLARGYLPTIINSTHWFLNDGFNKAVERYLNEEKKIVENQCAEILNEGPFKVE